MRGRRVNVNIVQHHAVNFLQARITWVYYLVLNWSEEGGRNGVCLNFPSSPAAQGCILQLAKKCHEPFDGRTESCDESHRKDLSEVYICCRPLADGSCRRCIGEPNRIELLKSRKFCLQAEDVVALENDLKSNSILFRLKDNSCMAAFFEVHLNITVFFASAITEQTAQIL